VELQGGNVNCIINPEKYPKSKFIKKVLSQKNGFVSEINTYQIGMASLKLGAGRRTKDDVIDHKAGIVFYKKFSDYVKKGDIVCELHSDSKSKINSAEQMIAGSIKFSKTKPALPKLIKKIIK
jgi:thymidine phosphorylase